MFIYRGAYSLLNLSLVVASGRLVASPEVDVSVGRGKGECEQADDEQVPKEPEVGCNLGGRDNERKQHFRSVLCWYDD